MFFVNHVLKFKFLAKRMSYAKVDCSHLNPDAKRLICYIVRAVFFKVKKFNITRSSFKQLNKQ